MTGIMPREVEYYLPDRLSVGSEITATFPGLPVLPSGDGALAARLVRIWRLRLAKFSTPRRASTGNPESSPKPAWISELTPRWTRDRILRSRCSGETLEASARHCLSAEDRCAANLGNSAKVRGDSDRVRTSGLCCDAGGHSSRERANWRSMNVKERGEKARFSSYDEISKIRDYLSVL